MERIVTLFMSLRQQNKYILTVIGKYIEIKTESNNIKIAMNNGMVDKVYLNNKKFSFDNYRAEELTQLMKW